MSRIAGMDDDPANKHVSLTHTQPVFTNKFEQKITLNSFSARSVKSGAVKMATKNTLQSIKRHLLAVNFCGIESQKFAMRLICGWCDRASHSLKLNGQ